jgi:hypothetical protein
MEIIKEVQSELDRDDLRKQPDWNNSVLGTPATLYSLFVPLSYNSGARVPKEQVNWVLSRIVRYAGGLTKHAPGVGLWVSPSAQVIRDQVLPIQIVVPPSQEAEHWFTCFAAEVAVVFEQECIFMVAQPLWQMGSA